MRFLLAQRSPVEAYPPVLNQARILESIGQVTIVDSAPGVVGREFLTSSHVRRTRILLSPAAVAGSRLGRLAAAWKYRKAFTRELACRPQAVVAFEPETAALLLKGRRRGNRATFKIIHLHEHPTREAYALSRLGTWSLSRTLSRLHLADLVVVADAHRAEELSRITKLPSPPMVVMNCPLLLQKLPASRLEPLARERGVTGPIIHYHGAVGPDHGLETTITSMQWWPPDAWFFVVGSGTDGYVKSLLSLATSIGVAERLIFLGRVPYDQVFSYAVGATVGMSMLDTSKPNWHFAAGASNKRFEYMALGIPQVTSPGPGIAELFERSGVALLADPIDARDVAAKINRFLESAALCAATAASGRALHKATCNYERQFEPVVERIRDQVSASRFPQA